MSAADEIVLAVRGARAMGLPEPAVEALVRRLADQYSTADLKAAQSQLAAELEGGR